MRKRNVYVIAGPNGAGKTTFARLFLPDYAKCPNFVNADLIAQGLAPFQPRAAAIQAGKLVLRQIRDFADRGVDFAFETTLAGKSHAVLFRDLKARGYRIHVFFLWIPNPELAIARIRDRVAQGGHDVSPVDVRRRFDRGVENFFKLYQPLADSWMILDNSTAKPALVAKFKSGRREIANAERFDEIRSRVS